MKLKYKFKCEDLGLPNCDFITYSNRKRDIIKRVKKHLVEKQGFEEIEVSHPEIKKKIKNSIRESKYVLEND